ncbi:MAG: hypothetical protein AAFV43_05670 [Planctomycetota bacterium]
MPPHRQRFLLGFTRLGFTTLSFTTLGFITLGWLTSSAIGAEVDPRLLETLARLDGAAKQIKTLSGSFLYTVTSARQQQQVVADVRLMKPNFARLKYTYQANPAFPAIVASDGKKLHTFTPELFDNGTRSFREGPYDSLLGAKQASGLAPGGGSFASTPVARNGANIRLWDAAPIQAFFDPGLAVERHLYVRDFAELEWEPRVEIDGVLYDVVYHRFEQGNIAGGEGSAFDQRLYVGPDGLVHMYVLEFESAGARGVQVARLHNLVLNEPMEAADFAFTPPAPAPQENEAE